jgi:hypothetical protein
VSDAASREDAFDTTSLARMMRSLPADQLAEGMRLNREAILGEVFRRFPEQASPAALREEAVIEWRISGGSGPGGYDRWFILLRDGRCETGRDLELRPRVTFTVGPIDLLGLVTGTANPARLVLTRRLRIRGDLLFAARMPQLFRVPRS